GCAWPQPRQLKLASSTVPEPGGRFGPAYTREPASPLAHPHRWSRYRALPRSSHDAFSIFTPGSDARGALRSSTDLGGATTSPPFLSTAARSRSACAAALPLSAWAATARSLSP